jgi:hypothetical protein
VILNRTNYDTLDDYGHYEESSIPTADFHKLVRNGGHLPNHPYYWWRYDLQDRQVQTYNGLKNQRQSNAIITCRGVADNGYYPGDNQPSPSLVEDRNIVLNKLLTKTRGKDVDLGIALGEFRETASLFEQTVLKVVVGVGQLRKGNASGALRTLLGTVKRDSLGKPRIERATEKRINDVVRGNPVSGSIRRDTRRGLQVSGSKNDSITDVLKGPAGIQLAITFGIRPLVNDVANAVNRLQRGYQGYPEKSVVRSGKESQIRGVHSGPGGNNSWSFEATMKTKAKITFVVTNPVFKTLDEVGFLNPLSVAWELVPFSFIVDWFVPIGTFLENVVPPQGVSFVDGYLSQKIEGSFSSRTDYDFGADTWHTHCSGTEVYKRRIVLADFPKYNLVVPDLSLSSEKIKSGLALLVQAALGGKTSRGSN